MPRSKKVDESVEEKQTKAMKAVKSVSESKTEEATKKRTLKTDVFNTKGEVVGSMILPETIFAAKINRPLMAQAVRVYLANQRQGSAQAKTRGQVQGSTKKMGRQKGSGRARHGSIRAPIYVGGGKAHGPQPKEWSLNLPKKMRRAALFSALSGKLQDKEIIVLDGLDTIDAKTKAFVKSITSQKTETKKQSSYLLVLPEGKERIQKAARNVSFVTLEKAQNLHTYEVLKADRVIFMKEAVEKLEEAFLKERVQAFRV